MFRITKVKVASVLAVGALTLGTAAAYAANTIPIPSGAKTLTVTGKTGTTDLKLLSLTGQTTLTLKPFTSAGQCVDQFATNRNLALAPTDTTATTLKKNYHGKLMSAVAAWCRTQVTSTTSDTVETEPTETPDATESEAPETDSGGQGHGHGHGHGHQSSGDN